jgi:hypothetical protein
MLTYWFICDDATKLFLVKSRAAIGVLLETTVGESLITSLMLFHLLGHYRGATASFATASLLIVPDAGILVGTSSGLMNACFACGLADGDLINAISLQHGTSVLWQELPGAARTGSREANQCPSPP